MPNANKNKGDRAERAVRDYVAERYAGSFKTRAGFDDDLGDIVVEHPAGRVALQVKDVGAPMWKVWYLGLKQQVATLRDKSQRATAGGVLVWKYRGQADPAKWHAVAQLDDLLDLLDTVYENGRADAIATAKRVPVKPR